MNMGKKNLIISLGLLVSTFLITNYAFAGAYDTLTQAKNVVQNVALSSFRNENLKTACLHDLDGINSTLIIAEDEADASSKNPLYQDALNTINSLILKTDGCVVNGVPDDEDWIVNCADSSVVHAILNQLADDINILIQ